MPEPTPLHNPEAIASLPAAVLEQMLEVLPEGVLRFDRQWRITYANPVGRSISRLKPEDFNGKSHWELYPDTVGTPVEKAYREAMDTGVAKVLEPFFYEPFGIWLLIHLIPVPDGLILFYRDYSDEHRLQKDQRESEERLYFALNAVNGIGTWDWDIPRDLVFANPRFAAMYGVDPLAAATGITIDQFIRNIHPGDIERVATAIGEAVRTGGDFASEYRLLQEDGSVSWVNTRGRCNLDADGKPFRFPGVAIDITEQKNREEAMRESEARYRVLTELNPMSLWTANPEGLVLYANQRFLEYIGYQFVPKTGEEYIQCFDPADRERVVQVWTQSITTGEDYDIEARLLRGSDGTSRWWHLRALPIRDEAGKIQQWLGTANDVHEKREADARLREQFVEIDRQRRELEAIYRGSPVGMAQYEPKELRLVRINNRQAEVFRVKPDDAIGKRFEELTDGITAGHSLIRRAAAGENVLNQDIEGAMSQHPDEYRYWNVNYSPIFAEDGSVQAIAAATIETTMQKRAESALIQSEKLAAVGRMASSIAHEINNPLESVMNLIYIARQGAAVPEVQTYLDLADQELRRVSVIANQTLRFHKQASKPQAISCDDLFSSVLSIYEGRFKNSGIKIHKRKRAQNLVTCFEGEIRQVLSNLVANAIDAMSTGGRLLVRSRDAIQQPSGRAGLMLTVADTGTGIDAEAQAKIFEPFFTTKGMQGTGLGLWISSEIMRRHHGSIRLRSSKAAAHHGTVFQLFLPYDTVPAEDGEA